MYEHGGDSYRYPDFTDFSANINLLGAPECAVERARAALDGITHYPQVGCDRLRQAIAELEQAEPQEIICGNGAAEVIFSLVLALKPRKAMVFAPAFQEYEQALKSVDCQVIREYLSPEQGFRITEHSLAQADDTIDMVFVCNPNNPTGVLTEQNMLVQLLNRCRKAGAVLVVDECFLDFVPLEQEADGKSSLSDYGAGCHPDSMKPFLKKYTNLFLVKAFTKTFGMPGLRLGYGLCGNTGKNAGSDPALECVGSGSGGRDCSGRRADISGRNQKGCGTGKSLSAGTAFSVSAGRTPDLRSCGEFHFFPEQERAGQCTGRIRNPNPQLQ